MNNYVVNLYEYEVDFLYKQKKLYAHGYVFARSYNDAVLKLIERYSDIICGMSIRKYSMRETTDILSKPIEVQIDEF